jgi:hypothetical protein
MLQLKFPTMVKTLIHLVKYVMDFTNISEICSFDSFLYSVRSSSVFMEEVFSVKPLCILFCRASSKGLHFESQTFSNIFSKVRERPFNLKGGVRGGNKP